MKNKLNIVNKTISILVFISSLIIFTACGKSGGSNGNHSKNENYNNINLSSNKNNNPSATTNNEGKGIGIIDLSHQDLHGQDFSNRVLDSVYNFEGANLSGANFSHSELHGVNIKGANLQGADLSHVDFQNTQLENINMSNSDITGFIINYGTLKNVDMTGAYTHLSYSDELFWGVSLIDNVILPSNQKINKIQIDYRFDNYNNNSNENSVIISNVDFSCKNVVMLTNKVSLGSNVTGLVLNASTNQYQSICP